MNYRQGHIQTTDRAAPTAHFGKSSLWVLGTLTVACGLFTGLSTAACDPALQSCAPASAPAPAPAPSPGAGQSCSPGAAGATCGGSGPASQGSTGGTNNGAGNPINVINANKYQMETDMAALPGELGLEIVRHYNSSSARVIGSLGMGWKLSYETELYVVGQSIQILQADGTRQIFSINPADPSQCAGARVDQGRVEIKDSARGKEFIWHWTHGEQAGRKLYFNSQGKLEQITAATGATLNLQRGPAGELLKVTDPQGRTLSIKYASKNQVQAAQAQASGAFFAGIQSIDSPVGRYGYQHGPSQTTNQSSNKTAKESPNPTLLIEQAANLIAVSLPSSSSGSSVTKSYHYEDARFPQALTGISINGQGSDAQMMSQRLSTYLYNQRGQAVLSVKGEPARLALDKQGQALEPKRLAEGTGIEQVHVDIIQPALPTKAGSTVVTNSQGQQTLYRHQIIGGEYRLLEARGAGCASCGPVNLAYSYDSLGRQTGQTSLVPTAIKEGQPTSPAQALQTTRMAYTAQGAPMDVTTTAPQVQYADPRWPDKPTLLVRPSVIKGQASQIQLSYNDYGQTTQISQTGFSPIDVKGQIASSADQASKIERTTKYTYRLINNKSVLTQIDGPLPNGPKASPEDSDITTLQYDQRADYLTATTQPGGFKSALSYDGAGRISAVKNAEGFQTTFAFDANLLSHVSSTGPGWAEPKIRSFKYDAMGRTVESGTGNLPGQESGTGVQTSQTYRAQSAQGFDAAGRAQWTAIALGIAQQNSYDTESRLLKTSRTSNAMAQSSSNRFDALGRLEATWSHTGQGYALAYNAQGDVQSITDERGRTTELAAGPAKPSANPSTRFTAKQTTPVREDLKDDFGRLAARISPDSGTTTYQHDAADRLIASTDAQGNTAQYSFDVAGRITRQVITASAMQVENQPNQPKQQNQPLITEWLYQGKQLVTVKFPTQAEQYSYDARGLRIAKIVSLNTSQTAASSTTSAVTRYRYDEAGVLQSTSLPDGSVLMHERNGQGQVVTVKRSELQSPWLQTAWVQRWASWILPAQVIAQDLKRDIVGIKSYTTGNGIEASYQRSQNAALARVAYRNTKPGSTKLQTAANSKLPMLMGRTTQDTISALLGVSPAHAADVPKAAEQTGQTGQATRSTLPGALSLPADPQALIDHRYLWDTAGNLLLTQSDTQGKANTAAYAYDSQDRLIIASQNNTQALKQVSTSSPSNTNSGQATSRYHYAQGKRVLAQEGVADSADLKTNTIKAAYQEGSHRWLGGEAVNNATQFQTSYNANGQPGQVGPRSYNWDALGRLSSVQQNNQPLASYTYNHRGERISKTVQTKAGQTTQTSYLYENGLLAAELNNQGQLTRQYIYLADTPIAVIDTPKGKSLLNQELAAHTLLGLDLQIIVKSAWNSLTNGIISSEKAETTNWLHTNHLGAPEAATDSQGKLIWQASYAPFGAILKASLKTKEAFTLNLRLPGQYEDTETGLHYNKQRYYDPSRGEYLSPDPMGTPDGPNGYAYVRYNPLKYVDPEGLILFAFDGTGNEGDKSKTNVWLLSRAYDDVDAIDRQILESQITQNQVAGYYIQGPGTSDSAFGTGWLDSGIGFSMSSRIDSQLANLDTYVKARVIEEKKVRQSTEKDPYAITLDIIGFSRGAASARDFTNQFLSRRDLGYYRDTSRGFSRDCITLTVRFLGLFDTVLAAGGVNRRDFNMFIPDSVQYVASAVAANEHRSKFQLESIGTSGTTARGWRIERGFVGAHADIGGGYNGTQSGDGGDLSDVALNWMYNQAESAGVRFKDLAAANRTVLNPIVHDERNTYPFNAPIGGAPFFGGEQDRNVRYPDGRLVPQRTAPLAGLNNQQSAQFIRPLTGNRPPNQVGMVDMDAYKQWLSTNYQVSLQ